MRALVFPGQGSQFVGMCQRLYSESAIVRDLFGSAKTVLGYDITEIMFGGPMEELSKTIHAQPAIFMHNLCSYSASVFKGDCGFVAGHSLGEYSALMAAGVLDPMDALCLVKYRAEEMQKACDSAPGAMAAVIGLSVDVLAAICEQVGDVWLANYNTDKQLVISGRKHAVLEAMELAKAKKARPVTLLPTSGGAYHCPLMKYASRAFNTYLLSTRFSTPRVPVYMNYDANPRTDALTIQEALMHQMSSPVLWQQTVLKMAAAGANEFIEVGPGDKLQGMIKRIAPHVTVRGILEAA